MRSKNFSSFLILDVCNIVPNNQIEIMETTTTPSGVPKVIFKARLQTANEHNANKRYYPTDICDEIVETMKPKAKGRSLFQEVDHPSVGGDGMAAKRRAVTVEMKNCGSLIRDIYREGDDIIGEIETLSGFLGPDMYNTIVYDKADIGYSLRMFGKIETEGDTGISRVTRPIRPITYDTVTNPSHKTARIMEFIPENAYEFMSNPAGESQLVYESIITNDNLQFEDNNESIYDYLDRIVRDRFREMKPVEFRL